MSTQSKINCVSRAVVLGTFAKGLCLNLVQIDKIPYYSRKELFTQLALLPRYKRYMEEYDRTHAISALPERSSHEES